jgi:hypothetical protein
LLKEGGRPRRRDSFVESARMADNKKLTGSPDNDLFNKNESYEVNYMVGKLHKLYPDATTAEVKKAVLDSANVKQFHNVRKMIENSAKLKLDNL